MTDQDSVSVRIGDAFGLALARCIRHGSAPLDTFFVVERDDGFVTVNDISWYLLPPDEHDVLERELIERARGPVLDLGCGGGRHAVPLAERGERVVGIDTSAAAVQICRDRGVDARQCSVYELDGVGSGYTSFLLGGQNVGLLSDVKTGRRLLADLAAIAAPGAKILGTTADPHLSKNPAHRAYAERNLATGRMAGQDRCRLRYDDVATEWFDYLYLSADELRELVEGTEWTLHDTLSDGPMYLAELRLRRDR